MPEVVAYPKRNDALFLIEAVHGSDPINSIRFAELRCWTRVVKCRTVFVPVFASRESHAKQLTTTVSEEEIGEAEVEGR